ncbi:MAG: hypothetical protein HYY84_19070 [Deltaproteobacteria bacterium]|nr:hypothetical protein [Deltaproteobacteria bacterium]
MNRWLAAAVVGGLGCAASIDRHQDTWVTGATVQKPDHDGRRIDAGLSSFRRAVPSPPRRTLVRSEMDAVLSRGLQSFVASIEVEALLIERRFVGWRLVRLPTGDRPSPIDVVEEDIVTRINDLPVERPGDWVKIWDELRRAPELKIEIMRGGELQLQRFPILRD